MIDQKTDQHKTAFLDFLVWVFTGKFFTICGLVVTWVRICVHLGPITYPSVIYIRFLKVIEKKISAVSLYYFVNCWKNSYEIKTIWAMLNQLNTSRVLSLNKNKYVKFTETHFSVRWSKKRPLLKLTKNGKPNTKKEDNLLNLKNIKDGCLVWMLCKLHYGSKYTVINV